MHFSTKRYWPEMPLNSCRTPSSRDPHFQKKRTLLPSYSGRTVASQPIFSRKHGGEMVGKSGFSTVFVNFSLRKS